MRRLAIESLITAHRKQGSQVGGDAKDGQSAFVERLQAERAHLMQLELEPWPARQSSHAFLSSPKLLAAASKALSVLLPLLKAPMDLTGSHSLA